MERNMKRSLTSAIVAGALLIGVACSGGGGVTPQAGPKIELTTPKSVSPALVKAPPMVQTAIQPASAMTSRTPATGIVPQSWTQIAGSATTAAAAADGSIWVLSDQPAGADKYIWHYSGGTWSNIPGMASQISIAPNGTLNVINSSGAIYRYSGGTWTSPGGGAKSITTLSDNSIVVVSAGSPSGSGVTTAPAAARGAGVAVYAGDPAHTVAGTRSIRAAFILNNPPIYYENTDNSPLDPRTRRPGSSSAGLPWPSGSRSGGTAITSTGLSGLTAQNGTANTLGRPEYRPQRARDPARSTSRTPTPDPTLTPTASDSDVVADCDTDPAESPLPPTESDQPAQAGARRSA